ncbi:hypothetical protein H8M03_08265 [Sphingomonas sabuli]|uniref:Uncharacterized protein n=1 Tax=Sphingomonas sabuli TaxID=2764186 RepID=A0A7G9L078_9SPHN|nr:hypothetical protein [Sphingomonas sabuli]QNM82027.1 hypothetical protein H8M03_08265 [Sphingomonas sabuli]
MKRRVPVPRDQREPLPEFTPVPRKCKRHDGWTPERQKAFIEALADTGSVSRAAAMTNMSSESVYFLRRQPGAESFRRAWEAALDYGVARMKDIAFERAIEGYLVPCFVGGRLLGWRRKYNDRLLMFLLRHYGEDANGRRTKVEYFSTRATAGAASAPSGRQQAGTATLTSARDASPDRPTGREANPIDGAGVADERGPTVRGHSLRDGAAAIATAGMQSAIAETTTVRTVTTGRAAAPALDATTAIIEDFPGVELDAVAQAEIYRILQDCAARRRSVEGTPHDPDQPFISVEQPEREVLVHDPGYAHPRKVKRRPAPLTDVVVDEGAYLQQSPKTEPEDKYSAGVEELPWQVLDHEEACAEIEAAVESVKRASKPLALPPAGEGQGEEQQSENS